MNIEMLTKQEAINAVITGKYKNLYAITVDPEYPFSNKYIIKCLSQCAISTLHHRCVAYLRITEANNE